DALPEKTPGASSPLFSPPFKGTMLCLGLETHQCLTGLCFRPESNDLSLATCEAQGQLLPFSRRTAPDLLCRIVCFGTAYTQLRLGPARGMSQCVWRCVQLAAAVLITSSGRGGLSEASLPRVGLGPCYL